MIGKQLRITPLQNAALKRLANAYGISDSEIVQRAIEQTASATPIGAKGIEAWEREKAFIATRMAAGAAPSISRWSREKAYKERERPPE